jgi:CHAT domain-containing protein
LYPLIIEMEVAAMKEIPLFLKSSCLFIAILMGIFACAPRMSLEESKQVSISMDEKPPVKPPRHISDILAVLDQKGEFDAHSTVQMKAKCSASPPEGANDAVLASFYQEKGYAEWQLGFMKKAREDFQLALIYFQRTGRDNRALLTSLGIVEKFTGNFQKAIDYLEESLNIQASMAAYPHLVDAYIMLGDLDTAERLGRESIDLYLKKVERPGRNKRKGGSQGVSKEPLMSDNIRAVYMNSVMASVLQAQGKYKEAEQYLRKELELHHSLSVVDRIPLFALRNRLLLSSNLALQQRLIDSEMEARQLLKESLGHGGIESEMTSKAVICLASVIRAQGRLKDAERLARAGIRILANSGFPSDSEYMGNAQMFLGNVLTQEEEFTEAMKQFDLARTGLKENAYLYEKIFTRNNNLMLTLLKTGRIDEAMQIISSSHEWNRKNFGEKHPRTIMTAGLRGIVHAKAGNDRQAFEDLSSALPILMTQSNNKNSLSQLHRTMLETYIDLLGRTYGTPLEEELGIHALDESFRIASFLGSRSVQTALGESSARAAAAYDPELSDLVRKEQDLDKQIEGLQETLSDAMMVPPDQQNSKALNTLKTQIDGLTKARNSTLSEINKRFPQYANFTSPQPADVANVRENLQKNEVFVSIYSAADKTYVWAVPKTGENRFSVTPLGKKELAQTVADLRKALDPNPNTLGDIPFDLMQAHRLYGRLLKPVESAWKGATDLIITVNGPLENLPFSILPTEPFNLEDEKEELFASYRKVPWLIRTASVTMLPSVNALVTLRSLPEGEPQRKAFAGFGDPIFNREQLAMDSNSPAKILANKEQKAASDNIQLVSRGAKVQMRGIQITEKGNLDNDKIVSVQLDGLNRLPDTAEEIRSIARVLKADEKGDIFLGKDFSKQRLRLMNLADRRVIAFATHALVPGDLDGLDQPALAVSSPSITGYKEDGLLTTDEILKMKLNADWVVLSACNTGAAAGQGAEAVSGLGKAFFYAGTRALLVSMWSVETTSAHKLVTGIFQSQEENKALSRAQALQKSMINMIDKETLKDDATGKIVASYAHPLFWAPFVIVGDPGKSNY